jgi:NTE family protein
LQAKIISDAFNSDMPGNVFQASIKLRKAFPVNPDITVIPFIYGGTALGDSIPYPYYIFSGGVENTINKVAFPFIGMDLLQRANKNACIAGVYLQSEPWKNHFFILKGNLGATSDGARDLLVADKLNYGYGLTYGFRSPIGPLELTLMRSNVNLSGIFYVNFGFWF